MKNIADDRLLATSAGAMKADKLSCNNENFGVLNSIISGENAANKEMALNIVVRFSLNKEIL
jgi:hypothetical protein